MTFFNQPQPELTILILKQSKIVKRIPCIWVNHNLNTAKPSHVAKSLTQDLTQGWTNSGKLTELKIIFSKVAGSKTATFLKLRYLFLYRYFVWEICLNFYGLVQAAYGDKSYEIGFNFIPDLLITFGHTRFIWSIFSGW